MIELDSDSLRRRAIDTRRRARAATSPELRRQFLELAETYDDLADVVQSSISGEMPALTGQPQLH
jgi:hypothetical protein